MRYDFIGQDLDLGDFVVFISPTYRKLKLARITGFKTKMIMVEVIDQHPWRTTLHPDKIAKVSAEHGVAKLMTRG